MKVLHGYRYVAPRDVARMILKTRRVCNKGHYLDCVTNWSEIKTLTQQYSQHFELPDIQEPYVFLTWYQENHMALQEPQIQRKPVEKDEDPEEMGFQRRLLISWMMTLSVIMVISILL